MDTRQVIKDCINKKDESAFRLLVDRYSGFAFSIAHRIVNDEDEAKDIVQESFIAIWKNMGSFDTSRSFENWLYKVVANKCLDMLRRKKRVTIIHPEPDKWCRMEVFSDDNPENTLTNREIGQMIRAFTQNLSNKQKIVFVLSELEGLTHDEIAEATGLAKASVKSNLNHARRRIGKMIEKHL